MAAILPPALTQFFASNGAPAAGGTVYTYVPGTTTPVTTYQNAAATIANANPLTLDSNGRCALFGTGQVRTQVFDAQGNLIFDDVTGLPQLTDLGPTPVIAPTSAITLTNAQSGSIIQPAAGSAITVTLPASPVTGVNFDFIGYAYATTITTGNASNIEVSGASPSTSVTVPAGAPNSLYTVWDGTVWLAWFRASSSFSGAAALVVATPATASGNAALIPLAGAHVSPAVDGTSLVLNATSGFVQVSSTIQSGAASGLSALQPSAITGSAGLVVATPAAASGQAAPIALTGTHAKSAVDGMSLVFNTTSGLIQVSQAIQDGALSSGVNLPNIAALRALTSSQSVSVGIVQGYTTASDGGGGVFVVDANDTTSADNGITIIVDAAARRWYRQNGKLPISAPEAGVLGTSSDSVNLSNALALAAGGVVTLPNDITYDFTAAVTNNHSTLQIINGAAVNSPNYLPGATDYSVFGISGVILAKAFTVPGDSTTGTGNEFVLSIQGTSSTTGGTGPYEKALIYVNGQNQDSSATYLSDFVGIESEMYIQSAEGRVWGYHTLVQVGGTGQYDGFMIGIELEMHNIGGTEQTNVLNTTTAKNAINAIAAEGIMTNALAIITETAYSKPGQFFSGITFWPGSIVTGGSAIILPNDIPILAWNSAGTATVNLLYSDTSNNLVLGNGSASVAVTPALNANGGIVSPSIKTTSNGSATLHNFVINGTAITTVSGQLSLGTGTTTTAAPGGADPLPGAPAGYLQGSLNGTAIVIPFYAA